MIKIRLSALLCGFLFGAGLLISQMSNPSKVLGFLDVAGDWDASLMLVMAGALTTLHLLQRFIFKRSTPILAEKFQLPTKIDIDKKLVIGAILFGVGWGISGFCPGSSFAALAVGNGEAVLFILSLFLGIKLFGVIHKK